LNRLSIQVTDWLGGTADAEDVTFGALVITAEDQGLILTEVSDLIAQATRNAIRVPVIRLAEWLVAHWWRLRWEARPTIPTSEWHHAHNMAAIGGGIAWPPLEISSDGEFVQISLAREPQRDAAGIRYLNGVSGLEVAADDFEGAVDGFLDLVDNRVRTVLPASSEFADLRDELRSERSDPQLARMCRWQARAGIDAGDGSAEWFHDFDEIAREAGAAATEDLCAVLSDPRAAGCFVAEAKRSTLGVDLTSVAGVDRRGLVGKPWERGALAARRVREALGFGTDPIANDRLSELLGTNLPATPNAPPGRAVSGGFRSDLALGQTNVVVAASRAENQRFFFARLVGLATELPPDTGHLLPVTSAKTAIQKFGRAFAQEFLCPWSEIEAATERAGYDESVRRELAERFIVSEMVVTTALVNRGKLDRASLEDYC